MRGWRLVPIFALFMVLSGGQTMLMVNQAEAACCNPLTNPRCPAWWTSMVHGSVEQTDQESTKFRILDDDGYYREITASQEVADAFKREGIKKDYGFSILAKRGEEVMLIAFVPNSPNHGKAPNKSVSAIVADYNKSFQKGAHKTGLKK